MSSPIPEAPSVKSRFTARHNAYQQEYFVRGRLPRLEPVATPYVLRQVEKVYRVLGLAPGDRLLEVGAGLGRHAIPMSQKGVSVVASDLSQQLIAQLEDNPAASRVDTLVCDMESIAEATAERFPFAAGFFMLHHLHDLPLAFMSLRRALRPGAKVAFCEPNAYYLPFYLQVVLTPGMTLRGEPSLTKMRPSCVFPAMKSAGFVDLGVERYGFFPPLLANRRFGRVVERGLERLPLPKVCRAFQIFYGRLPR
jgi:2-polyprenyl-3-methyl-5-hydroxy-6-metoxy-1,4-benzoquinol methylase